MLICRTIFPPLARAVKLVTGSLPLAADSRAGFDGMGHRLGMSCWRVWAVTGYGLTMCERVQAAGDTEYCQGKRAYENACILITSVTLRRLNGLQVVRQTCAASGGVSVCLRVRVFHLFVLPSVRGRIFTLEYSGNVRRNVGERTRSIGVPSLLVVSHSLYVHDLIRLHGRPRTGDRLAIDATSFLFSSDARAVRHVDAVKM